MFYRIIPTVRKHIVPNNALACGRIPIRIDKPTPARVIVPALQVLQPGFCIVDIPAVAQGVGRAKRRCHCTGGGQRIAPCVVGVARGDGSLRRFRQAVVRSGAKRSFDHILHQNGHSPAFTLAARMRKTALLPAGSVGRNTAPGRGVCAPSPTR